MFSPSMIGPMCLEQEHSRRSTLPHCGQRQTGCILRQILQWTYPFQFPEPLQPVPAAENQAMTFTSPLDAPHHAPLCSVD